MPVHNGHLALIEFAQDHCDELIVSMSYTPNDPIDGVLRYSWLNEILGANSKIKTAMVKDDFDNELLPIRERTLIWADFIRRTFPKIDVVFSSEHYGEFFAHHLNAENVLFDLKRSLHPISATSIREDALRYWDFIPKVVRPYFVKKICF